MLLWRTSAPHSQTHSPAKVLWTTLIKFNMSMRFLGANKCKDDPVPSNFKPLPPAHAASSCVWTDTSLILSPSLSETNGQVLSIPANASGHALETADPLSCPCLENTAGCIFYTLHTQLTKKKKKDPLNQTSRRQNMWRRKIWGDGDNDAGRK